MSYKTITHLACISVALSVAAPASDARPRTRDQGLHAMYGQLVIKGFAGLTARDRRVRKVRKAIEKSLLGGVILFQKNIKNPKQVAALTKVFRTANTRYTPIIAVDEEGGAVERLNRRKGFRYTPGHFRMQQRNTVAQARKRYDGMARELIRAGFNTNFGPVVDLRLNPNNPVIARNRRSFGLHPLYVARYAQSFVAAHEAAGIGTALKHWPGHGSSTKDTHWRFVDVTKHWKRVEIEPYRRMLSNGYSGMIMTSHIYHRDWGNGQDLPASLSPIAVKTMLRDELGYDGVVITDDLQMRSISTNHPLDEAIIMALAAGNDIALIGNVLSQAPEDPDFAVRAIARGVKEGRLNFKQLYRSWQRVIAYKKRLRR